VWLIAGELKIGLDAVANNRAEWRILPPPPMHEMLERFEQWSRELLDLVSRMPEKSWDRVAYCQFRGTVVLEQPIGVFLWSTFLMAFIIAANSQPICIRWEQMYR
jgi:hypothetical protein